MGFEQLAELKKQLQQQARQARQQEAAEKTTQNSAEPSTEHRAGKDGEGRGRRGAPQGARGAPNPPRHAEQPGRQHARKPHGGQGQRAGQQAGQQAGGERGQQRAQPQGQAQAQQAGQQAGQQTGQHHQVDSRGRQKNRPPQEPVDPVVHAIGKLQKRFPAAFPKKPAPKLPLKIGILEDLLPHAQELALSEAEVREAIATWCRGSRYWSCLTDGAARVDLNGAAAGQVTARDMAFARNSQRGGMRRPRHAEGASQASDKPQAADQPQAPEQQTASPATEGEVTPAEQTAQAAPENAASASASANAATE